MKAKLEYVIWPLVLIAGYILVYFTLPKYTGQYFFFVVMILADLYLWSSIKKQVFNYRYWLTIALSFLYWVPFISMGVFAVVSAFIPIIDWNDPFRTYYLGFIFVFYVAKLLPILFLLLSDIIRLIDRVFILVKKEKRQEISEKAEGMTRSKFLGYVGFLSGGLLMGTMFTGMFKWVYQFNVVNQKIRMPNLPSSFNGLKIVQISDMHLGSWTSSKPLQQAVDMINATKPDLILFTGDLVNYATKEAFRFESILNQLNAKLGVYTIMGNHDYGDYVKWPTAKAKEDNLTAMFDLFNRMGWKLMSNENKVFENGDGKLALIGVENWGANPRFPKYGNIEQAMVGADADVKILMTHDPTHWEEVIVPEKHNIDLSLSGHTHGFQFGIEIPGIKWSPAQWMYKRWAGLYKDDNSDRYLYVNRGLGVIGYPGRIGILPEITVFELTA